MHFLLEARDRGVAVSPDMISAGNNYLQLLARQEGDSSMAGLRQRAYAVYLLTRQGNVTTNSLAAVQKRLQEAYPNSWKNDLAAAWLAASSVARSSAAGSSLTGISVLFITSTVLKCRFRVDKVG